MDCLYKPLSSLYVQKTNQYKKRKRARDTKVCDSCLFAFLHYILFFLDLVDIFRV
jgi:hypothetical protein